MRRSLSQIREDSRNALAGNYILYFIVLLITVILTAAGNEILSFLGIPFGRFPVAMLIAIDLFLTFVLTILTKMLQAGQYFLSLNIARYNRKGVSDLFLAFRYDTKKAFQLSSILALVDTLCSAPMTIAFSYLLYTGALDFYFGKAIPVQTIALSLLGGLAGMLVLKFLIEFPFSQVLFLYIDHQEYTASECIRKSFEYMRSRRFEYLKLHLSLAGYYLLCLVSMGLGVIWVVPYVNVNRAGYYMSITGTYKPY